MIKTILVLNPGSSSLKFALYKLVNRENIFKGAFEHTEEGFKFFLNNKHDDLSSLDSSLEVLSATKSSSINSSYNILEQWFKNNKQHFEIVSIRYRVVHGGDFFDTPTPINESVLNKIRSLTALAPLHQPLAILAIENFMSAFPKAQHVAYFDTAFHRSMPKEAQLFPIPEQLRKKGIKPYGFHGLSYQYVSLKIQEKLNELPQRMIVAHLGSGSSVCAIREGKSIATSMSFSPLDGLPMSTRSGAIDPAAVLYLIKECAFDSDELLELLNKKSGLLALSGISGDFRTLLDSKDEHANFAIDYFVYRLSKEIGAYTALLKGLDALVFTGGVGANSWLIRNKVMQACDWLGVKENLKANQNNEFLISDAQSKVSIYSMKTDEESLMA